MIKYRPNRGTLRDSMEEEKEFASIDEMFEHIILCWNNHGTLFTKDNLSISNNIGKDHRIEWKETRYICTNRMGNEIYQTPQCIGMCSLE